MQRKSVQLDPIEIIRLCDEKGFKDLKHEALAELIGVPRARISDIFDGQHVSVTTQEKVAKFFGVPKETIELQHGPRRTRLIGREDIMALLRSHALEAIDKRGGVSVLRGPMGVGKTAIGEEIEHVLRENEKPGRRFAFARAACATRGQSYVVCSDLIGALRRTRYRHTIEQLLKKWAPLWFELSSGKKIEASALELQKQFRRAVFLVAKAVPVVLFVDDMQWMDVESSLCFSALRDDFPGMRFFFLGAMSGKPDDEAEHPVGRLKHDLIGAAKWRTIDVPGITEDSIRSYLTFLYGESTELAAPSFVSEIRRHSRGLFLYINVFLQSLEDDGLIRTEENIFKLSTDLNEVRAYLAQTGPKLIARSVTRLKPLEQELLFAAALQGNEFHSSVVAWAVGRNQAEIENVLRQLTAQIDVIRFLRMQELPNGTATARFRFEHRVYRNTLRRMVRVQHNESLLAKKLFDALELSYAQETSRIAAKLAHLARLAGTTADQVRYLGSAAERESGLGAFERAGDFAETGLRLLGTLAGSRQLPQFAASELRLLFAKGVSIMARFGYADARLGEIFEAACRLSKQLGDPRAHVSALYGLWSFQLMDGQLELSRKTAQACLRHVQRHRLVQNYLLAHYALGASLLQLGRLTESLGHLEKAVGFRDRVRSGSSLRDERVTAQCQLARVRWLVGRRQEALEAAQQALKLAEADKQPEGIAYALFFVADIFHFQKDRLQTRESLAKLREVPGEHEDAQKRVWATALSAWTYGAQRGSRRAIQMFRQTLEEDAKYGPRAGHTKMRVVMAKLLLQNGFTAEALAELKRAWNVVVGIGERYFAPEIFRVRGECALALRHYEESLVHFKKGINEARKIRARSLELRGILSASGLLNRKLDSKLRLQIERLCERFLPPLVKFFSGEPSTDEIEQARRLRDRLNTSKQNIRKPAKSSQAALRRQAAS